MAYQYVKLVRMVRNRLIKAFQNIDEWRVEEHDRIVRLSDGLWVHRCSNKSGGHFEVGNTDHGVAQIVIDGDQELDMAFHAIRNFHPTNQRARSVLTNLGIEI